MRIILISYHDERLSSSGRLEQPPRLDAQRRSEPSAAEKAITAFRSLDPDWWSESAWNESLDRFCKIDFVSNIFLGLIAMIHFSER